MIEMIEMMEMMEMMEVMEVMEVMEASFSILIARNSQISSSKLQTRVGYLLLSVAPVV
jgi:hypothetical protein